MKKILIGSIISLLIIGCSKSPLDTMDNMDQNTSQMKDITQDLSLKTADMKEITEFLYRQSRKPETIKVQEIAIRGMQNAKSIERKLYYSVMYTNALEYTLWTSQAQNGDTVEYLYDLYYEGILNVTTLISELLRKARLNIEDIKTISPTTKNSNKQNLMVLAYALGERASEQSGLARKYNIKAQSFFELSQYYLRKTAINQQDSSSNNVNLRHRYISELTQSDNKRMLINLINLRMNVYTAMIISKVSTINQQYKKSTLGILSTIHKAKFLISPWTVTFGEQEESLSSKNSKINLMNSWALKALNAKSFLKEIGEKPILNKTLKRILKNMRFQRVIGLNYTGFESNMSKLKTEN